MFTFVFVVFFNQNMWVPARITFLPFDLFHHFHPGGSVELTIEEGCIMLTITHAQRLGRDQIWTWCKIGRIGNSGEITERWNNYSKDSFSRITLPLTQTMTPWAFCQMDGVGYSLSSSPQAQLYGKPVIEPFNVDLCFYHTLSHFIDLLA